MKGKCSSRRKLQILRPVCFPENRSLWWILLFSRLNVVRIAKKWEVGLRKNYCALKPALFVKVYTYIAKIS